MLPDCLPLPPASNPDQDEIGDGLTAVAYWLEQQTIYVMNLFELLRKAQPSAGNGGTGNADPVTCAQLTLQVQQLLVAMKAISDAITKIAPGGGTPIDLTPLLLKFDLLIKAIQDAPAEPGVDLSHLNAQADDQKAARDATGVNLLAVDADIQALIAKYGVQL